MSLKQFFLLHLILFIGINLEAQIVSNQQFIAMLDLTRSDMVVVSRLATQGNYDQAVEVWKDTAINRLRRLNLDEFGWHSYQPHPRNQVWADYLLEKITEATYLASPNDGYRDFLGKRGMPGTKPPVNWLGLPPAGVLYNAQTHGEGDFKSYTPLLTRYWELNDANYMLRWMELLSDFSSRQKAIIDTLSAANKKLHTPNWTDDATEILMQGTRVKNILRGLALVAKNLPGEAKIADWNYVLKNYRLPVYSSPLINTNQLMQIAAGMVRDNPAILLKNYKYAGRVPNQRFDGITSVMMIALVFPEFKDSPFNLSEATWAINNYLEGMTYPDGGMLEQSFNYNDGDVGEMEAIRNLLTTAKVSLPDLETSLSIAIDNYYHLTWALRSPLMSLPIIGEQGHSGATQVWKDAATAQAWINKMKLIGTSDLISQQVLNAYSGSTTNNSNFKTVAFPYSGNYVQRTGWDLFSQYLFFTSSRPSRGHKIAGVNSIQLIARGRDMLVSDGHADYSNVLDPGITNYLSESSTLKNNTIMVDNLSQTWAPIILQVANDPIKTRYCNTPDMQYMEGNYTLGYGVNADVLDVSHQRQLTFLPDAGIWIMVDLMTNTGTKIHSYSQTWNFAPWLPTSNTFGYLNSQVVCDSINKRITTIDPSGPNLRLQHFSAIPKLSYLQYYGTKNPYYGWYSIGDGVATEAVDVHTTWSGMGNMALGTVLYTSTGPISDIIVTDLSTSQDAVNMNLTLADGSILSFYSSLQAKIQTVYGMSFLAKAYSLKKLNNGNIVGYITGGDGTAMYWNNYPINHAMTDYSINFNQGTNTFIFDAFSIPDTCYWNTNLIPQITKNSPAHFVWTQPADSIAYFYHACYYDKTLGYQVGLGVGSYTEDQMISKGIANDDVSSLKIAAGYEAVVYADNYFSGQYRIYRSDAPCLISDNWNDITSSIIIRKATPNVAPIVSLFPATNVSYCQGSNISITASATDIDGSITKVDFYSGNTLLTSITTTPYVYTWTNAPLGTNTIKAVATDNSGASTTSPTIIITVNALPTANTNQRAGICEGAMVVLKACNAKSYNWSNGTMNIGNAATYNATKSGSYTVSVIDSNNCSATFTTLVTVNPLPTITAYMRLNRSIWQINQTEITANEMDSVYLGPWPVIGTGWTWVGPNGFSSNLRNPNFLKISLAQAGIYTANYTDSLGCTSSKNFTIKVVRKQVIELSKGWNIISTNIQSVDSSIATVFTGLDVQEIKSTDAFWEKGQPAIYNNLKTISAGKGYLVKMNVAGTINITGIPMVITTMQFANYSGWQLIGCPYQTSTPISSIFNQTNSTIVKNFDGFWKPNTSINSLQSFEPGKGYFIKK